MVEFIPITTQELVVIVPKDHPLAAKDSVTLKETLAYQQIIFGIKADCARLLMTYSKVSMHTQIFFARLKKILSVPVLFPKASVL